RARVARIDAIARDQIALERAARGGPDPRRGLPHRLLVVYRTCANPASVDLTIDPNDRDPGTIFGGRPALGNPVWLALAPARAPRRLGARPGAPFRRARLPRRRPRRSTPRRCSCPPPATPTSGPPTPTSCGTPSPRPTGRATTSRAPTTTSARRSAAARR